MGIAVASSALLMAAGKIQIADRIKAKNKAGPVIWKPIPGSTKMPDPIIELKLIIVTETSPSLLSKPANSIPYLF